VGHPDYRPSGHRRDLDYSLRHEVREISIYPLSINPPRRTSRDRRSSSSIFGLLSRRRGLLCRRLIVAIDASVVVIETISFAAANDAMDSHHRI
jgi:hypothetical protein